MTGVQTCALPISLSFLSHFLTLSLLCVSLLSLSLSLSVSLSLFLSFWFSRPLPFSLVLQALEEELNQKKKEQEIFFKVTEDSECLSPSSSNRLTKFLPYSESSTT